MLRHTNLISVIGSLQQYRETSWSNYDAFFDGARKGDFCKNSVSLRFLQGAAWVTCWHYFRVTRLMCSYPEALQPVEKVNDEAAAGDKAGGKGGLGITQLLNALLLESKKQNAVLLIETSAVHNKNNTNEEKPLHYSALWPSISMLPSISTSFKLSQDDNFSQGDHI